MDFVFNFFTAFGLSSSAGLNAYIPLLITGLVARYTEWLTLNQPFDTLENPWVLGTLGVLLVVEMFVDKIPALDTANDIIHTVIRPGAGAVLFAANAGVVGNMDPILAAILGLVAAGSIHATKTAVRPVITASTGGFGNPVISFIEDVVAFIASLVAILMPLLMAFFICFVFFFVLRWWWRRYERTAVL